jgi:hypothetical protein
LGLSIKYLRVAKGAKECLFTIIFFMVSFILFTTVPSCKYSATKAKPSKA